MAVDTRQEIARAAVAAARALFTDVDLAQAELADMSTEELAAYLADHGVELDVAALERETAAALANDAKAIEGGLTDPAKRQQVEERVAKLVVSNAKRVARDTVRKAQMAAWDEADGREWDRKFYMWVSVGSGVCDSCHSLHGQVFALDQWESIGVPGSGATLCGDRCRCTLVPVEATEREITRYRNEAARAGLEGR